ncbi:MAG: tyrosinase family protein [Chitinophagales bacterium]
MNTQSTVSLLTYERQHASRKVQGILMLLLLVLCLLFISVKSFAQADLMVRDCLGDETNNGSEPSSSCTNPIWTSDGIKLTQNPYSGYTPYPFTTAIGDAWDLVPDEDAEYRDATKYSNPNWIYVKVSNMGNANSDGSEVLKVYWAKASTGLSWPLLWLDAFDTHLGCPTLFSGDEITKPRMNWTSLSLQERENVVHAFQNLDLTLLYQDGVSWWDKQDQIHQATHVHNGPAFLPWHRELVNRLENLLRVGDYPNIKLPYWAWQTDPSLPEPNGSAIMLELGGSPDINKFGLPGPLGTPIGSPFNTFDNGAACVGSRGGNLCDACGLVYTPSLPPFIIERNLSFTPNLAEDQTLMTWGDGLDLNEQYDIFRTQLETTHGQAHQMIGGNIQAAHCSFQDPFVFILHSETDRLFAKWQRNFSTSLNFPNEYLYRLDNSTTINGVYGDDGLFPLEQCPNLDIGGPPQLLKPIEPWANNHLPGNTDPICSTSCLHPIRPWESPDDEDLYKTYFDPSVVSPPIYDDARLRIPILQPGESVIMQIPWFPPNPDNYSCFGLTDQNHFCLLARIVTPGALNEGMSTAEIADVGYNAYYNNNIAWKNIQVYDVQAGSGLVACVLMRNMQKENSYNKLQIKSQETGDLCYFKNGTAILILPQHLFDLWRSGGSVGQNIQVLSDGKIKLLNENAWIGNILLERDEMYEVCIEFQVSTIPREGNAFQVNLEQEDEVKFIGGEQFTLRYVQRRFEKPAGSENFSNSGIYPNPNNGSMQIDYTLADNQKGSFVLYDYLGRKLDEQTLQSGIHNLQITRSDLSSGVYYGRIIVNNVDAYNSKIVIIK